MKTETLVNEYLANKEYLVPTTLCAIMTSFGSDKGDERHNYTSLYSKLFAPLKEEKIHLFELGIGSNNIDIPSNMGENGSPGASLRGWALFFPHAKIFGADVDKQILFEESRIKTYYCDQTDKNSIQKLFSNHDLNNLQFDIIIEDGLHTFDASLTFLENSLYKLKRGGFYITEDLTADSRVKMIKLIPKLKEQFSLSYIEVIIIPNKLNHADNALLIIQK